MDSLKEELKVKILDRLNIQDVTPDQIDEDDPFVGGELAIDSIDILELVIMIEEDYGVRIDNKELGAEVFKTFGSLVKYIAEHRVR